MAANQAEALEERRNKNNQTTTMSHSGFKFIRLLALTALVAMLDLQPTSGATSGSLPSLVSRATDSLSALIGSRQSNQQQLAATAAPQAASASVSSSNQQVIKAEPRAPSSMLQSHLSTLQTQAQRQLSQLNGLVAANTQHPANASSPTNQLLDVLSNVGKAIQQQISSSGQVQIVNSSPVGGTELANNKKNEYQSIVVNDGQQLNLNNDLPIQASPTTANASSNAYREQGEVLRQEIIRRAGQLQQVVASSMEVLKNSSDLIVRRLLEQLNNRLDQAKSKADKIINEVS